MRCLKSAVGYDSTCDFYLQPHKYCSYHSGVLWVVNGNKDMNFFLASASDSFAAVKFRDLKPTQTSDSLYIIPYELQNTEGKTQPISSMALHSC